jgi:preprotein translocase subunit SecE
VTLKPFTFFRQVRAELTKIVWPTRKETMLSAFAVFLMVVLCAIFLFFTDQILSFFIRLILNLGA